MEPASIAARSATPLLKWARGKVRERSYASRLVKVAARQCDVRLSRQLRRTLARWVKEDLGELLCEPSPDPAVRRAHELSVAEQVDLTPMGDLRTFVVEMSESMLRELPIELRDQSLGRMIRAGFANASRTRLSVDLSDLPHGTAVLLRSRGEPDLDSVIALVDLLHAHGVVDPTAAARLIDAEKLTEGWSWWQWASVGLFADAHEQRDSARTAFLRTVELGAPEPDAWRAYAAMTRVTELGEVDTSGFEGSDLRLLFAAFRDLSTLDVATLPSIPAPSIEHGSRLARHLHASAHLVAGSIPRAIAILEESLAADPGSLTTEHKLAQAHLSAAQAGLPDKVLHLERALQLAVHARDEARLRDLPLRRSAVEVACQAALMLEDWPEVLNLGLTPPDGNADGHEATGEETMVAVATSALLVDRIDVVERILPELPEGQAPSLYRSQLAHLKGDLTAADEHLRRAWDEVTDWGRAVTVLLAWARQLDDPLPSLALKGLDTVQANRHQEIAEIVRLARSSRQQATARLRSFTDKNSQLGINLVWLVEASGDSSAALATAEQILASRADPELHEYVARSLMRAEPPDIDRALKHALAFARGSADTSLEPRARRLLAVLYETAGDRPAEFQQELRWLADAGDETAVWALMSMTLSAGDIDAVVDLLDGHALRPRNRSEVVVHLRALLASGRYDAAATAAIEALDDYEDDDDFCAGLLGFVHSTGGRLIQDEQVGEALQLATAQFLSRAPEHPSFHSISTDDIESVVEMLEKQLTNRRRVLTVGRWRVRTGRLPLGMLSATLGVDYIEIALGRALFSRGHHPDPEGHEAEVLLATTALDGTVLADTTAIATATAAGLWPALRGAFRDIAVTEPGYSDVIRAGEMEAFTSRASIQADATGRLIHLDTHEDELAHRAQQISEMARVVRTCRVLPFSRAAVLPSTISNPRTDPWVSAIEISHSSGLPLLCDDFSTRRLAASVGVQCFSLYALIDALAASGRLDPADAEGHRLSLLESGSVGLPLTDPRAREADPTSILRLLSDGAAWIGDDARGPREVERALADAIEGTPHHDAGTVLALALIGVAEQALLTRRNPVEVCGVVTALAIGNHARNAKQAADLVRALDWTLSEWLLHPDAAAPVTAKALSDLLLAESSVDPDIALSYVMSQFSDVSKEARLQAAAVLLGTAPPPINAEVLPDISFSESPKL